MESPIISNPTIAAISTPPGTGGVAMLRISGPESINIVDRIWRGSSLRDIKPNTLRVGHIVDPEQDSTPVDRVVLSYFKAPKSFTGEDVIEISCHGSQWIQREILNLIIRHGASAAGPGEFTQRAFMNRRIDLAQAEGIADLIAASSRAAHNLAMQQTEGTYSARLEDLRQQLIDIASLLELELDFSEEDVEFADRSHLVNLVKTTLEATESLSDSYATGRAIKEGIPVVIAGAPNAGKSTMLNKLLGEEKAIVSHIAGTTRDIIEDTTTIDGITFRFIDTAGLRNTEDTIEQIGIRRAEDRLTQAAIVIWMLDTTQPKSEFNDEINNIKTHISHSNKETYHIIFANKSDLHSPIDEDKDLYIAKMISGYREDNDDSVINADTDGLTTANTRRPIVINGSASTGDGLEELKHLLTPKYKDATSQSDNLLVTNARHYEALQHANAALMRVLDGLETGMPSDLITLDLREAVHHIGSITHAITTSTLLETIFSRFCIGK